jgi:hypothetical protein
MARRAGPATGDAEIGPNEHLGEAFARLADELHGQYLIGYAPPKRDGKPHEIEVKVSQSGLKARARRTCVAARAEIRRHAGR